MTAKFSSVIFGVLIFVAIAATLFSTGLAEGGPAYEYCLLKCIDRCHEFCKTMEYPNGGDCNTGPCCCL
uniref:Knottin scorpion toxin-like domain-containing protein n=1 Tax=Oryza punctata TaxID=4537 RepID=A0A0E0MHM8_ORYPU